jgi:hypothetical protein
MEPVVLFGIQFTLSLAATAVGACISRRRRDDPGSGRSQARLMLLLERQRATIGESTRT